MTKSVHDPPAASYLERLMGAGLPEASFLVHSVLDLTVGKDWGRRGPFVIKDCHLLYVRGGKPTYEMNGQEVPLAPGHVVFAGRGTRIRLGQDRCDPPRIVPVRFDRYLRKAPCPLDADPRSAALAIRPRKPERFERFFDALSEYWMREHCPAVLQAINGLIAAILFGILIECRAASPRPRRSLDDSMEKARMRMEREPESNWSIAKLASDLNLSESSFSRRFREYTGVAPKTFQMRSRMRFARFLLEQEDCSVKEVAARLGYSDAFVFSRQFQKIWGLSPSRMRI